MVITTGISVSRIEVRSKVCPAQTEASIGMRMLDGDVVSADANHRNSRFVDGGEDIVTTLNGTGIDTTLYVLCYICLQNRSSGFTSTFGLSLDASDVIREADVSTSCRIIWVGEIVAEVDACP